MHKVLLTAGALGALLATSAQAADAIAKPPTVPPLSTATVADAVGETPPRKAK